MGLEDSQLAKTTDIVLWATTDVLGSYVEFHQTTQDHIAEHIPDVADYVNEIKCVVEDLHMVKQSSKFEDTFWTRTVF